HDARRRARAGAPRDPRQRRLPGADRDADGPAARQPDASRAAHRDDPDATLRLARGGRRARRVPGELRRGVRDRRDLHGRRRRDGVIVAITGSSGLVGSALVSSLRARGDRVIPIVRRAPLGTEDALRWEPTTGAITPTRSAIADAVVHLAGESVTAGRWTAARKARIRDSRVAATARLAHALARATPPPRARPPHHDPTSSGLRRAPRLRRRNGRRAAAHEPARDAGAASGERLYVSAPHP